jgi:hemolysin activation/secretion protein
MKTHVNAARVLAIAVLLLSSAKSIRAAELPLTGTVAVKSFEFEGNTKFSSAQLNQEIADIAARNQGHLSLDDLEEARQKLTLLYINAGYNNSGAILPDQDFHPQKGAIKFQIVEGKLSKIAIQGKPRLRREYLKDRIWHDADEPLNAFTLRTNLEILRQNPNLKSINAELKPGEQPGQSALDLQIGEFDRPGIR